MGRARPHPRRHGLRHGRARPPPRRLPAQAARRHLPLGHHHAPRRPRALAPAAPEHGKPDTVSRSYRRWARAGLRPRLLVALALHPKRLATRAHRICCAFRRAIRLCGRLHAIVLARRLKLFSALPAPSQFLPDPDLSGTYQPVFARFAPSMLDRPWHPPRHLWRTLHLMHRVVAGRARIPRWMEPA